MTISLVGLTISTSMLWRGKFQEEGMIWLEVNIRDGTLVSPVLELEVLQGQRVVGGLDIVGEDVTVIHLEVAGESGLVGAEAAGDVGEETDEVPEVSQTSEAVFLESRSSRQTRRTMKKRSYMESSEK